MSTLNSNVYSQDGKIVPFQMDFLPEFFRRKCEMELKETLENKKQKLQELQTMLSDDQMTSGFNFKEDLLVQYLRHSKYDVQRALKHIQKYVAFRNKHSSLFSSIPDHCLFFKKSSQFIFPLPNRTPDGCTLLMSKPGNWDPRKMEFDDYVRSCIMVLSQLMRDPMTQINGLKVLHDFSRTSWRHFRYCTPHKLHFITYSTIDCIPARYKEIHLFNESFVMRAVWAVMKRFLSEKIKNRVYFHSKVEDLVEFFPPSVLPVEYGGELQDIHLEDWLRKANREHETNTIEGQPNYY